MSDQGPRAQGARDLGPGQVHDARLLRLAAENQAAPDLTGETLGRYRIVRLLGQGGMGVVYEAFDTMLENKVALKILSEDLDAPDQLFREARLAAALEHENIVPVHDVGEDEGIAYFTMMLVEGGPLKTPARTAHSGPNVQDPALHRRRRERKDQGLEAARIALTISRAVAFCHRRGILHGDLKPQNVLVDNETGRHFVTDFGLAARQGIAAGPVELGGTPTYMAPELWQGDPSARSTMADVWSIGAILYELVSGRPPFPASSWDELRRSVAEDAPPALRGLDSDLVAVCLCCLEKEPARRYATAFELADDLTRFLRGDPVHARPLGPGTRLLRRAARHPLVAALVTLLLVAALYAGIETLSRSRAQRVALHAADATALLLARLTALQFDHYSALVVAAAGQTQPLASALSEPASSKASDLCARSLAEQGAAFSTWFLLDANGTMLGRAPAQGAHPTLGLSYKFRDYFRGAQALVTQHQRGAYVSHAYRSEGDDTHEIAISVPVTAGDRWIGVLVATLATGPALGSIQFPVPDDEDLTAALLAPQDGPRLDIDRGPELIFILYSKLPPGGTASPDSGSRAFERVVPVANTPFSVLIRVAFGG
jgi:hypothetical protein